uniref:Uncharacterized protein n=1 Tax=Arundo donax TaxID=35708 RepID=A0A0A9ENP8_ARUDO
MCSHLQLVLKSIDSLKVSIICNKLQAFLNSPPQLLGKPVLYFLLGIVRF